MSDTTKSIEVTELWKSFGTPPTNILKGLTFNIDSGDLVSITGRSGSGKSTLLYILSSLDPATKGNVKLLGKDISAMSAKEIHEFRNQNMGFVFQFHYLLPELTALENVLMPAMKTGKHLERKKYALELFEKFGIANKVNSLPRQLSGGEQQRVAIARALVMEPKVIFADEPTGNLDSVNGAIVLDIFKRINSEKNTTLIYVTHDAEFASLAHKRIHLVDGMIDSIQTNST